MTPRPWPIEPGSLIRMVTPASPLDKESTQDAQKLLESWGYRVEFAPHAFDRHFYLAGSDEDRAADLTDAFLNSDASVVFCCRGGYGCARLFPYVDVRKLAASGKLLAGFSDITTFHLAFDRLSVPTLHAPMAITLSKQREPWVYESLRRSLLGEFNPPEGVSLGQCAVPGTAEGIATGGCLCLITDSIGTDFGIDAAGKIVFIEDVDENPHRVDAMLTHLLNAHVLDNCAGIVVGEMTRTDERQDASIGAMPWKDIVTDRLAQLKKPMIIDFPFGHAPNMLTVPFGVKAHLDASNCRLSFGDQA